jgi:hypothetical protein
MLALKLADVGQKWRVVPRWELARFEGVAIALAR